ncbi:zinc-binding dehydrogenase [Podospora appendiculata]|uniref:Zinc-binding dehydrogenase n=1 Tax=Podospora appendiculata TaxID=314037 RepID=A0AAE1CHM8_9PEZI|nr:zinc-binding dehydrogenase [Podospora appendiculata]
MSPLPKTFRAAVFVEANKPLELQDVPLRQPGPGQILVKVLACGVCHSDVVAQAGVMGSPYPLIPGHEIVGEVAALGEGVTRFKEGDRVGGGWHGGHDGVCRSCQRSQFQICENGAINGITQNGGYAEYVLLRVEAVARIPADLDPAEVAPLLCAGVTVFNGMRKMHVEQGGLVAIQGLGGLGHLAVQYSKAMGYRTVAISRGTDKRDFAFQLGAHEYIDTNTEDPVERLAALGGASLIVSTAPSGPAFSKLTGGLEAGGKLLVLAPMGPVEFDTLAMVLKGLSVHGWPSGHALDAEEAIAFAKTFGIKCLIEKFPLEDAPKAFDTMMEGKPRFRNVLVMQ